MEGNSRPERGRTRRRIQSVALELFAEHGYEQSSLREIAERLGVTKAAVYYHFKAKEDIVLSLFDELIGPLDALVEWAEGQPRTVDSGQEVLRRYSIVLVEAAPLVRLMYKSQTAMHELGIGESFKSRLTALVRCLLPEDPTSTDKVRCMTALFALHAGLLPLSDMDSAPAAPSQAVLDVASDLITQAHQGGVAVR